MDCTHASNEERIDMLKIAISKMKSKKKIGIEMYEIKHCEEKNYTYQTLKHLVKKHPKIKYYYFMGYDQLDKFHLWKKPKKLSRLVSLVCFKRGGYEFNEDNFKKYHFHKLKHHALKASSSEIREGNLSLLDKDVLKYISKNGLYLETMIKNRMKEKRYQHSLSVASLAKEIADENGLDGQKAYIAGILHDVAKEMKHEDALRLMKRNYPQFVNKPEPIWHQWLSAYVSHYEFLVEDEGILKAIEDHTTASPSISKLGMCLYVADKLDPLRGYDSSKDIELCKKNIVEGFKQSLISFYQFSKSKNREIDPCFFDVYNHFVKG